ncbi:hypothetical protein FRC12_003186 [Ceratobasidium sp. 428]|nr:hypothetical protein FRC12_003186 [Ceratobasidium sp. 428]
MLSEYEMFRSITVDLFQRPRSHSDQWPESPQLTKLRIWASSPLSQRFFNYLRPWKSNAPSPLVVSELPNSRPRINPENATLTLRSIPALNCPKTGAGPGVY